MTTTPELDRAIDAGHAAVNAEDGFPSDWREQGKDYETDRTYFRAGIAELLRGLRRNPKPETAWDLGYDAALDDVAAVAGLEGEG